MSWVSTFFSYAMLTYKLMLPLAIARKLLFLVMGLVFLGVLIYWVYDSDVLLVICMGTFLIFLLIAAMSLPAQALALVTSKHIMLLANLRWILAAVFCLYSLLIVLVTFIFGHSNKSDDDSSLLLIVFFLASSFMCLSVVCASRIPGGQGFLFAFFFLLPKLVELLLPIHPLWLFSAAVVVWGLFLQWWLNWRPQKHQPNFMLLSFKDMDARGQQAVSGWSFLWGKADTWIGSRVLGVSDSFSAHIQRFLVSLPILVLSFVPAYFFLPNDPLVREFLFVFMLLFGLAFTGSAVLPMFCRHIKFIWLAASGNRKVLLRFVEYRYWLTVLPGLFINLIGVVMLAIFLNISYTPMAWSFLVISAVLNQALTFNLVWIVYQKSAASTIWLGTTILVNLLLWAILMCWSGQLFELPLNIQPLSPVTILVCLTGAVLVTRYWLNSSFSRINFLRAV